MHSQNAQADEALAVVGIWLSTNDRESLSELICDLDPALPCAYVIQQWSPDAAGLQWDDLARETSLKVRRLNEGDRPQPGTLLVAPANAGVTFHDGRLSLVTGKSEVALPWVNDFFWLGMPAPWPSGYCFPMPVPMLPPVCMPSGQPAESPWSERQKPPMTVVPLLPISKRTRPISYSSPVP